MAITEKSKPEIKIYDEYQQKKVSPDIKHIGKVIIFSVLSVIATILLVTIIITKVDWTIPILLFTLLAYTGWQQFF